MKIQIGKFMIEVSDSGFPVWTKLSYENVTLHGIHHHDLRDLEYAIQRARLQAKRALGSDNIADI